VSPEVIGSPWQLAQAKRARKAAKLARDMERTAEWRRDGALFTSRFDGQPVRLKGLWRFTIPMGYWDWRIVGWTGEPRWRHRLNRRRERGPIGKPCWASGQRRAGRYVVETAVSISTPGDVAIDAGPRGVWTSWGGWMSAEEAAR
jgi:hypothetical protein